MDTQVCTKCPETGPQPLSNFHRRGSGYQRICKACRCAESKAEYHDHGKSRKTSRPIPQPNTESFPALESRIQALEPRLRSIAARFTRDPHEADDLYSEMVTGILLRCKAADNDAFLVQCAKWAAQASLSKRYTAAHYCEDLDTTQEDTEYPGLGIASRTTEDEIIQHEAFEQFRKVIATLPEKHQKIIAMVSIGMSQREIAVELNLSEQTISQRLMALRAQLSASFVTSAAF